MWIDPAPKKADTPARAVGFPILKSLSTLRDWTQIEQSTFTFEPSRPIISRRELYPAEDAEGHTAVDGQSSPLLRSDHRDFVVRSVIDVHLWNRAGWTGVAFAHWGPSYPPAIALMFTNEDAPRKIFGRWRERLGEIDKQDEIYVAIVRGISVDHPAHYRVLITSRPPRENEISTGKTFTMASRIQTMDVESDANLMRFLNIYGHSGTYLLLPAILKGGRPEFLQELAILKQELSVKVASEVNEHDLEAIALGLD